MTALTTPPRSGEGHLDPTPLRRAMRGRVVAPSDADWEDARAAWNLSADQHPALVAFPVDAADVQAVVRFAVANDRRISPQSTGHAALVLDPTDTILVRLSEMRAVRVDPVARIAHAEAGAWWADVTEAARPHGLVGLAGSSPDVGVAGYCLGGGVSWLGRRHGLATNQLLAIEVVTADGRLVRCDLDHEPELFWALRGGGGNYGVVTALEMALFPVREVVAGIAFFPWERSHEVLSAWADWTRTVPDTVTSVGRIFQFPPIPEIPEPLRGGNFVLVEACMLEDQRTAEELFAPIRALGPTIDTFGVMAASDLGTLHMDPDQPSPGLSTSRLLSDLPPAAIDAVVDAVGPTSGSALISVEIRHVGGALAASSPDHGALDRLDGEYLTFGLGVPFSPEMLPAIGASLRRLDDVTAPWDAGQGYSNFVEQPVGASHFFPDSTLHRLRAVRRIHDPEGRFQSTHPIPTS